MAKTESSKQIPKHMGIILDGNGRWAKGVGLNAWTGTAKASCCSNR